MGDLEKNNSTSSLIGFKILSWIHLPKEGFLARSFSHLRVFHLPPACVRVDNDPFLLLYTTDMLSGFHWCLQRIVSAPLASSLVLARCNKMERLNSAARLMLVSDLDYTMVDHDDADNSALLKFNSLWEAFYRPNSLLVFSTGRSPTMYKELRKEKPLLTPDIAVMSVGTEIGYGNTLSTDQEWEQFLNQKWDRKTVTEETSKFPELVPQPEVDQRPHKVSFFIEKLRAPKVINVLNERLEQRGLDIKIIYSGGIALDVLPQGAGKGQALAYLMKKFEAIHKVPASILVCGDSGNDAELFTVPGVYGVMVSNAQEELLEWHAQNAKTNNNIIHATRRCAAGIVEAIDQFKLGPSTPPREILELLESKATSPGYEIVKFYLLYERWRRAEVQKPENIMKQIKSSFHPTGTFVHPSAVEKPLYDCLDALEKCYGDKKGQSFSVWLDKVTFAQISSDSWKVKFDKWELFGETRVGCSTTALLISKEPDEFIWMHVQQTWLNGSTDEDQTNGWII